MAITTIAAVDSSASTAASWPTRARPAPQRQQRDQREHQVELLLDGQRPQVLEQRRPADELEVRPVGGDLPPVRHVARGGEDVAAQLARLAGQHEPDAGHRHQQEPERGQQPPGAPGVEVPEREPPGPLDLVEDQRRDEEAGQDEEDVDAEEPAAHPRCAEVVDHDAGDGERADPVQAAQVGHPRERHHGRHPGRRARPDERGALDGDGHGSPGSVRCAVDARRLPCGQARSAGTAGSRGHAGGGSVVGEPDRAAQRDAGAVGATAACPRRAAGPARAWRAGPVGCPRR